MNNSCLKRAHLPLFHCFSNQDLPSCCSCDLGTHHSVPDDIWLFVTSLTPVPSVLNHLKAHVALYPCIFVCNMTLSYTESYFRHQMFPLFSSFQAVTIVTNVYYSQYLVSEAEVTFTGKRDWPSWTLQWCHGSEPRENKQTKKTAPKNNRFSEFASKSQDKQNTSYVFQWQKSLSLFKISKTCHP